jgi:hypothetical protein
VVGDSQIVEIDTQIDLMLECPGVLLSEGSRQYFHEVIRKLQSRPVSLL